VLSGGGGGSYSADAVFANVNGLVDTGNVEVAGLTVGHITGISVRIGEDPRVTMRISEGYRLRAGVHAVIELGSLAGQLNRYIAIENGTGAVLPPGTTIPVADTSQPVEIDQFLSALDPRTRTNLRDLLHAAVATLKGRGPDIERALHHSAAAFQQTAALLTDASADGAALRTLVARASQGAAALASEPQDLTGTIAQLSTLLTVAASRQQQITQSLERLPGAFGTTTTALTTLGAAVPAFSRLLAAAGPALRSVGPLAATLPHTGRLAAPAFRAVGRLVARFQTSSPAIAALLAPPLAQTLTTLGGVVDGLNPFIDPLRARAPDVLGWIPLLGDAAANYNINGHGVQVLFSPRPAPQRPIPSDSCGPGWLLRPFDRPPGALGCDPWTNYTQSFVGGGQPPTSFLTAAQQAPHPGEFGG
jgi:phospholipid/cholesterol/gamma-HCH transport system substrate-binding protein